MADRSILQIVSGFKPAVDGMGDMARRLGDTLWREQGIRSHFVVSRQPATPLDLNEIAPNTLSYSPDPSPAALLAHIDALQHEHTFSSVLLHYGSYAYSRDGKPAVFAQAMESLASRMRLLIFFHEIYAVGMPWRRAFWTKREQVASAAKLLHSAQVAFTSNAKYVRMLGELNTANRLILKAPVISNVGEPKTLLPLDQRPRQLIVFGQLPNRLRLYREYAAKLESICHALNIGKVVDVGSGESSIIPAKIAQAPVVRLGFMNDDQASEQMANSIAGVIGYWPDTWEKSGVMAAYEAHAMVPILVPISKDRAPKITGLPFITADAIARMNGDDFSNANLQAIASAAHAYYTANQSVSHCACVVAEHASA